MTKTALTQVQYAKVIAKYTKRFSVGGKLTRKQMTNWFKVKDVVHEGTAAAVQKSNLQLVHVQAAINKLLRPSGLYLRSRNYYSEFYIANKDETKRAVLNYQGKSAAHRCCSDELEDAMGETIADGTWGSYSVERTTSFVSTRAGAAATAGNKVMKRKINRMKLW